METREAPDPMAPKNDPGRTKTQVRTNCLDGGGNKCEGDWIDIDAKK
jgi:hypothetical protein